MKKFIITAVIIGLLSPMIVLASDSSSEADAVHIRSLAASCAACHGTHGNAIRIGSSQGGADEVPALAGTDQADIIAKLQAFKSGERSATVMQHHAKGLTTQEITALAGYFSAQPPHVSTPLISQKLRADHAN